MSKKAILRAVPQVTIIEIIYTVDDTICNFQSFIKEIYSNLIIGPSLSVFVARQEEERVQLIVADEAKYQGQDEIYANNRNQATPPMPFVNDDNESIS